MIVWRDLLTDAPADAAVFYAGVFGWEARDGRLWRGEEPLAGLVPLDPEIGWPAHWLPYVAVGDVGAVTAKVLTNRGSILAPPEEGPERGFAVVADPEGTPFGLVRGATKGAAMFAGDELWCEDDAVRGFFTRVFGWTARVADMGALGVGWTLSEGGEPRASVLRSPLGPPASWVPWVEGDPNQAAEDAVRYGGRVALGPLEIEGIGRVVLLVDPAGALLGVAG